MTTYRAVKISRTPLTSSLCVQHFKETDDVLREPHDVEIEETNESCIMCTTPAAYGRECENCQKPLHPHWPAVYCSNECAIADL